MSQSACLLRNSHITDLLTVENTDSPKNDAEALRSLPELMDDDRESENDGHEAQGEFEPWGAPDCPYRALLNGRATGNTTLLDPDTRDEITINPVERICVCFR
jgi:hypothetical protein